VQGSKAGPIALRGCKEASISTGNVSCSGAELLSLGAAYAPLRNSLSIETAEEMVYVKASMPAAWYS